MKWPVRYDENIKLGLAVLFLILLYWPVSLGQYTMKWDMLNWFYPMRLLIGESLQAHLLPLWNPYIHLGFPIFVDPQSGALYPVTWVLGYFFGYDVFWIGMDYFLHVVIGFWGFKKLGQTLGWSYTTAIVFGLVYAGCGFFVGNAQHLTYIISAAWIPWVIRSYYELWKIPSVKAALSLSFFLGLLLTGGYPAFFITVSYGMVFCFIFLIFKKIKNQDFTLLVQIVKLHFLAFICFLMQTACFLFFFIKSMPLINRTAGLTLEEVQALPFSPMAMISFWLPFSLTNDTDFWQTGISMANGYIGLGSLIFVALGLWYDRSKPLGLLFMVSLFFTGVAFGDFFVLREFLYNYFPLMDMFRYPSLFRLFFILPLLIIAGSSLEYYRLEGHRLTLESVKYIILVFGVIISLLIGYIMITTLFSFSDLSDFSIKKVLANDIKVAVRAVIQGVIQLLILGGLFLGFYKNSIKSIYFVLLLDVFLSVQLNSFSTIVSNEPLIDLQEKIDQLPTEFIGKLKVVEGVSHMGESDLFPMSYNKTMLQKEIARNGYNNLKLRSYVNFFKEEQRRQALLWHLPFFTQPQSEVELVSFTPTEVILKTNGKTARQLIYTQINYPGWQAFINGQPTTLSDTHSPLLAVNLSPGDHEVRFYFTPTHLKPLLFLSLFTTLIFCGFILFLSAKAKRQLYTQKT